MTIVDKVWGCEIWHHNGQDYCMKELILNRGYCSSLHAHKVKRETFLVVRGVVRLEVEMSGVLCRLDLSPGQSYEIAPGTYHRFRSLTQEACVVEASTFHNDSDVYRKEEAKEVKGFL